MTGSQQLPNDQQPSAFNALGSYADRIKDANGNPTKPSSSPASTSTSLPVPVPASSSLTPNGDIPKTNARSPSATPSSSSSSVKPRKIESPSNSSSNKPSKPVEQADGSWETVKSNRQRTRQQEDKDSKHGSNSKNWRDRSNREGQNQSQGQGQKQKTGDENEKKSGQGHNHGHGHGKSHKKQHGGHPPAQTTAQSQTSTKPAPTPSTVPAKPAWGALTQSSKPDTSTSNTAAESSKESLKDTAVVQQSQTVSSSPSLNGTTVTANSVSIPPSIGSPNLSSETASTSTASASVLSKAVDKLEEEGSWRNRPKSKIEEQAEVIQPTPVEQPKPAQPKQAAPPPKVNAWEIRKKTMAPPSTPASSSTISPPKTASSTASKDAGQKPVPNGHVKVELTAKPKKKTAARATSSALPPPIHDATLWPDVNQAAEVVKASEDKKEKAKDKSTTEDDSVVEESTANTGTGKKPKWTPIPASELLAAVDQVAENTRRQNRAEANAKKRATASKPENEASGSTVKGAKPKKPVVQPVDNNKKAGARSTRAGSISDVKASSIPNDQQPESADVATDAKLDELNSPEDKKDVVEGEATTPLTREISKQSRTGPSKKDDTPLSPPSNESSAQLRLGTGPIQSRPMTGSNTAPLPQQGFHHNNNTHVPRGPRGRDGRASFNGRGRGGGFRSGSAIAHKSHQGFGSPPLGANSGLPIDAFSNGNGFQRGFGGMGGFQSFYPVQGYGQTTAGPGIYDPLQAQYGANAVYRAGLPPPPMPQTVVPNLDATRFYVLGQIEYYFSMQNLAMDFFLRQQMDSEGWIDISMIASFNRVKSLTPDISIVKECMSLSSLLELKEESVRLSGQDASRWVLPDARKSKIVSDPISPSQGNKTTEDIPNSIENSLNVEDSQQISQIQQRGLGATAADVENALMKSSNNTVNVPVVNGEVEGKKEEVSVKEAETVKVEEAEKVEEKKEEEVKA